MTSTEALTKAREEGGYAICGRDAFKNIQLQENYWWWYLEVEGHYVQIYAMDEREINKELLNSTDWTWQPTLN